MQLESAEVCSLAVIGRLASTPLLWVQWLSGKSVRLVNGRSRVQFPAGSLWIFFLSLQNLHQVVPAYIEPSHQYIVLFGQLENTETRERKRERKHLENVSQSHGHTLAKKSQMGLD